MLRFTQCCEELGPLYALKRANASHSRKSNSTPLIYLLQSLLSTLPAYTATIMSSPTSRRSNRNSTGGTPRRTNRSNRNSLPPSDPPASQGASQQGTPRAAAGRSSQNASQNTSQSQVPPTSSPLFFRSSPAGSESQSQNQGLNVPRANGAGASSPLAQQNDRSSQGGQTPKASGMMGAGELISRCDVGLDRTDTSMQNLLLSTTLPVQMPQDLPRTDRDEMELAQLASSFAIRWAAQAQQPVTAGTISTPTSSSHQAGDEDCLWMRMATQYKSAHPTQPPSQT